MDFAVHVDYPAVGASLNQVLRVVEKVSLSKAFRAASKAAAAAEAVVPPLVAVLDELGGVDLRDVVADGKRAVRLIDTAVDAVTPVAESAARLYRSIDRRRVGAVIDNLVRSTGISEPGFDVVRALGTFVRNVRRAEAAAAQGGG